MNRIKWLFFLTSRTLTIQLGIHQKQKPFIHFVCGYPRSGTTWFSEMLSSYLGVPCPRHYLLPITYPSVIHTHSDPYSRISNCFYIVRDGRDALVSFYYYIANKMKDKSYVARTRFLRLLGRELKAEDIEQNFSRFLEVIFNNPLSTSTHWGAHAIGWLHKSILFPGSVIFLKYENLRTNTSLEFSHVLQQKFGIVDEKLVEEISMSHQFDLQKRKFPKDHKTYLRKGASGDWKSVFNQESREIFDHFAGDALIELEYEKDHSWV